MSASVRKPEGSSSNVPPPVEAPSQGEITAAKTEAVQENKMPVIEYRNVQGRCSMPDCKTRVPPSMQHIACRCTHVFCNFHRPSEKHFCTFDFKKHDLEHLADQLKNPKTKHGIFGNGTGGVR